MENCYNCFYLSEKEKPPFLQCSKDSIRKIPESECLDFIEYEKTKNYLNHCIQLQTHLTETIEIAENHRRELKQNMIKVITGEKI